MAYSLQDYYTGVTNGTPLVGAGAHNPIIGGSWFVLPGGNNSEVGVVNSALAGDSSGNSQGFIAATATAFSPNELVEVNCQVFSLSSTVAFGPIIRATSTNYYLFDVELSAGAVELQYYNGTSFVNLSTLSGVTFGVDTYKAFFVSSGTSLAGQLQRTSDNMWLNSSGAWQSGQTSCITATDSNLTAAGHSGMRLPNNLYFQYAGIITITSGTAGTPLPGALTPEAVTSTSTTFQTAVAGGGTPPYTYELQRAPAPGGVVGTYVNVTSLTPAVNYTDSGLPTGTNYAYRVLVTDSLSVTAYSSVVQISTLIVITAATIKAAAANCLGSHMWFPHPTLTNAFAVDHSGGKIAFTLSNTGNINLLMATADTTASHEMRASVQKNFFNTFNASTYFANFYITNASPNQSILFNTTPQSNTVYAECILLGGEDWYGVTSTPSWLIFNGIEVDPGCTVSGVYSPALPTGTSMVVGDSFTDSGGETANLSFGQSLCYGLNTFGGQVGVGGTGWQKNNLGFPGGLENWILMYANGISRISGGNFIEPIDRMVIVMGRNDDLDITFWLNATIAAVRAVTTTLKIHVCVHPAKCGGYPPTTLSAVTTASATSALIAAGDSHLYLHIPPDWLADGLFQGGYGLPVSETTSFVMASAPHAIAEFAQKYATWYATQIFLAEAGGGGGSTSSSCAYVS